MAAWEILCRTKRIYLFLLFWRNVKNFSGLTLWLELNLWTLWSNQILQTLTENDLSYLVLRNTFLVLGNLIQTNVQGVVHPFFSLSEYHRNLPNEAWALEDAQKVLHFPFCQKWLLLLCEIFLSGHNWTNGGFDRIILLRPDWAPLKELMSRVRTIFGWLRKS